MTATPPAPSPAPRPPRWPFALGAAVLLGLLVFLTPPGAGDAAQGTSFLVGHVIGVAIGALIFCGVVYGVLRLASRGRTPPAFLTVAFWTLLVVTLLSLSRLVGSGGRAP